MEDILKLTNLHKKYPTFELKDVSFSVQKGSIMGFIGRNGAGKTTTLKGIMNLVHFDSGNVEVFGLDMKQNELEIKQKIGFALSEINYYPNKTIRQISDVTKRFYKNFDNEKFEKYCQMFKLNKDKKLEELSSGMKVKYNIAIALSHDAELLILDEPTSGLDPISRDEILDIFRELVKSGERAILFSTHITSDLDKCATDIAFIHEGEIIYEGTKDSFVNSYRLIKGPVASLTDELKTKTISYKDLGNKFEGLILTENEKMFSSKSIEIKEPDLEEIMIYVERSKNNEKFVF